MCSGNRESVWAESLGKNQLANPVLHYIFIAFMQETTVWLHVNIKKRTLQFVSWLSVIPFDYSLDIISHVNHGNRILKQWQIWLFVPQRIALSVHASVNV